MLIKMEYVTVRDLDDFQHDFAVAHTSIALGLDNSRYDFSHLITNMRSLSNAITKRRYYFDVRELFRDGGLLREQYFGPSPGREQACGRRRNQR